MVGRDRELAELIRVIESVDDGGDAVAVLGDAGIGKSMLLHSVAEHAAGRGFQVLVASGVESEAQLPFAGLHHLLRPVLDDLAGLSDAQRSALRRAVGIEDGQTPEVFLVALAVLNLLADLASTRPVLLAVDDVHWLDGPSHETLAFVARRIGRDAIVVIGTLRPGYSGPFVQGGLREIEVSPLDDGTARSLLAVTGEGLSAADQMRILQDASGNPLALVELPTAWRTMVDGLDVSVPLTTRLERAFAGRLDELDDDTRAAVLTAAVDEIDQLAEILAGTAVMIGEPVGVVVLEAAAAAGLLSFDELRVRFRHPLVRSAVLQAETLARRQAASAAIAAVVDDPYRRAWHRAHAVVGHDDDLADELERTHAIALRRGSVPSAIWALERSAQLSTDSPTSGRRLLLAAEHAFGLGRADLVDRLLAAAERTPLGELDLARMEWIREIFNDGVPGDATRVMQLCDIAERSCDAGDDDLALNLLLGASLRCWWADTGPAARARVAAVTSRRLIGREQDPRHVAALAVAEPVLQAATVMDRLAKTPAETVADADALRLLGMAAHAVGDPVRAIDYLARSESKMRDQGRLGLLSHVLTMQILDRLELGEWERAAACAEEGRQLAHETGQPIWDMGQLSLMAIITGLRGERDEALRLANDAEQLVAGAGLNDLLACVQMARGFAWASSGEFTEAYGALRRMFDPSDAPFHPTERFHAVMVLAECAAHAGLVDDARRVIEGLEREALVTPSTTLAVGLSYARAVLAGEDSAEELYTEALRQDLTRWPWPRARLQLAYGSWLRRQRRVAESREPLRSAQMTLDLIGASTWAERARLELRAAGERPLERRVAAADALSPQELQIARLAAEGLSNKEIGERLYLSHRTVGSHLYRIFPKLDITSRTQLAHRLDLT